MFSFIKRFFTDETAFLRFARGGLMALGAAAATGQLPIDPTLGALLIGVSGTLGAGDKNKGE